MIPSWRRHIYGILRSHICRVPTPHKRSVQSEAIAPSPNRASSDRGSILLERGNGGLAAAVRNAVSACVFCHSSLRRCGGGVRCTHRHPTLAMSSSDALRLSASPTAPAQTTRAPPSPAGPAAACPGRGGSC